MAASTVQLPCPTSHCRMSRPFEPLPRLSAALGGPTLWVKRDDATGSRGNKVRKLEYLMADAAAQGADMVVTVGATQSNHCRQTAAAAKVGMRCELARTPLPEWPPPTTRAATSNSTASSGRL